MYGNVLIQERDHSNVWQCIHPWEGFMVMYGNASSKGRPAPSLIYGAAHSIYDDLLYVSFGATIK